jgi:RNA polymerase sigma factor (sigma-70 family)
MDIFTGKSELDCKALSREETNSLIREFQLTNDPKVLEKLIFHNKGFIIKIAYRYWKVRTKELDFNDMIQECSLGIVEAAKRFSIEKGFNFISYAESWMKVFCVKAIRESEPVYFPAKEYHLKALITKIYLKYKYGEFFLREPSIEEIKNGLGNRFSQQKIENILNAPNVINFSTFGHDSDTNDINVIEDSSMEETLEKNINFEKLLNKLSEYEANLIVKRFIKEMALNAIAEEENTPLRTINFRLKAAVTKLKKLAGVKDNEQ